MSEKTMSNHTLYLIQASYATAPLALAKLQQLYAPGDQAVLMGESVLHADHEAIAQLPNCHVLDTEQQLLNPAQSAVKIISYSAFADLCLQFSRCVTLK